MGANDYLETPGGILLPLEKPQPEPPTHTGEFMPGQPPPRRYDPRRYGAYNRRLMARKRRHLDGALAVAICAVIPPDSVVADLGAGGGALVAELRRQGYDAIGFDATRDAAKITGGLVLERNLAIPCDFEVQYDWAVYIEVGEHIPEPHLHDFLRNVTRCASAGLVISWAPPRMKNYGRGHVSCRSPAWVRRQLRLRGWLVERELTEAIRVIAGRPWQEKLSVFAKGA